MASEKKLTKKVKLTFLVEMLKSIREFKDERGLNCFLCNVLDYYDIIDYVDTKSKSYQNSRYDIRQYFLFHLLGIERIVKDLGYMIHTDNGILYIITVNSSVTSFNQTWKFNNKIHADIMADIRLEIINEAIKRLKS